MEKLQTLIESAKAGTENQKNDTAKAIYDQAIKEENRQTLGQKVAVLEALVSLISDDRDNNYTILSEKSFDYKALGQEPLVFSHLREVAKLPSGDLSLACLPIVKYGSYRRFADHPCMIPSQVKVLRIRGGVGGKQSANGGKATNNNDNNSSSSNSSSSNGGKSIRTNSHRNRSKGSSNNSSDIADSNRINQGGDNAGDLGGGGSSGRPSHNCALFQRDNRGKCCSEDILINPNSHHYCIDCDTTGDDVRRVVDVWCCEGAEGFGSVGTCFGCLQRAAGLAGIPPACGNVGAEVNIRASGNKQRGDKRAVTFANSAADTTSDGHISSQRNDNSNRMDSRATPRTQLALPASGNGSGGVSTRGKGMGSCGSKPIVAKGSVSSSSSSSSR